MPVETGRDRHVIATGPLDRKQARGANGLCEIAIALKDVLFCPRCG